MSFLYLSILFVSVICVVCGGRVGFVPLLFSSALTPTGLNSPKSAADTNSSRATTTANTASTPTLDDHFDLRTYLEPLYNAQVAVDQSSAVSSCLGVKFQSKLGIVTFMPTAPLQNEEHSVVCCAIPSHEASHASRKYGYPYVYSDANSVVYVIGRGEDCVNMIESIRSIADAYRTMHHVDMPTRMLTMKIGDMLHKYTLQPGACRPRAVNLLCVDCREAHMYKVDVAGNIFFARALALGRHSADLTQWLLTARAV